MDKQIINIIDAYILILLASYNHVEENPFWANDGQERFDIQDVFEGERILNLVVVMDGSVIATCGGIAFRSKGSYRVRRSMDGGTTLESEITFAEPGLHVSGVTVDENSVAIM